LHTVNVSHVIQKHVTALVQKQYRSITVLHNNSALSTYKTTP